MLLLKTGEDLSVCCLYIIPPHQIVLIPLFWGIVTHLNSSWLP